MRDYSMCKPMLEHLGIKKIRLMTNNPRKLDALEEQGFTVVERVPHSAGQTPHNERYLETKAGKLGHLFE
jgi:GTP cyclohydrolase II